jgi:hypothetical protein
LSSSWDFLEISLFVLEQHGHMEMLVAESHTHYQFTAVNFANQIRYAHHFSGLSEWVFIFAYVMFITIIEREIKKPLI